MNRNFITRPIIPNINFDNQDRIFPFFIPLVTGAILGGAAVAVSRPRPIIGYPAYPPYGAYGPYRPYGTGYSYSGYGNYPIY